MKSNPTNVAKSGSYYPVSAPRTHYSGTRVYGVWLGYLVCIAVYALVFGLWQIEPVPTECHVIGVLIAAICLFPTAVWMSSGKQTIPAFELICVAYLFAFSMPLYLQPNQIIIFSEAQTFSWDDTYATLCISALGIGAMVLGYYGARSSRMLRFLPRVDLPMDPERQYSFFKLAFGFSLFTALVQTAGGLASIPAMDALIRLLNAQVFVAIILLAYRVYRGQENARWATLLYAAAAFTAITGLASGLLESAVIPLLLLLIVRWAVTRKFPVTWAICGLAIFVVLNSVKATYRSRAWYGERPLSVGDKVNLWIDLSQQSLSDMTSGGTVEDTLRRSMSRFDLLHSFVYVHQMTPSSVPFYQGETYAYLLYGWVPRFLWPDKPIAQQANIIFAVDYRLLPEDQAYQATGTMIGIGHLPEAYANFDVTGVFLVMALQGMLLAAANAIFNGSRSEGGSAIYLSITVFFLNGIGSATAALFMLLFTNTTVNALLLRRFAKSWRAPSLPGKSNNEVPGRVRFRRFSL